MNEYVVLALDGLLYLAACGLLVILTAVCVRVLYRGHLRASWMTAVTAVFLVAVAKSLVDSSIGRVLPAMDPYPQMAVGAAATFVVAGIVVYWRYASSIPSAMATGVVLVLAMNGLSMGLPIISDRVLPPGNRIANHIDSAYSRTRQARDAARDFKTINESAKVMLASSLHALADLSSKEEFEALKKNFRGGVKFWAERKAEWDAMTPEEREANRRAMAEFMAEQGLSSDRHSLAAIKNASVDDVQNLVAFMKDMQASTPAVAASQPRPPAESLQILLRNIRGMEFSAEDHEAMATFSKIFFEKGMDAAIAEARTELVTEKIDPEWAGTFLAAMLETKTGLPVTIILNEPEAVAAAAGIAGAASVDGQMAPQPPPPPVVRMVTLPTKFGYVRVPRGTKNIEEITAAAERIPVTGVLVGGERVRVAMGNRSLALGEIYRVNHGAKVFSFRMEEVVGNLIYVAGVGLD
jgi:hypothetical protein